MKCNDAIKDIKQSINDLQKKLKALEECKEESNTRVTTEDLYDITTGHIDVLIDNIRNNIYYKFYSKDTESYLFNKKQFELFRKQCHEFMDKRLDNMLTDCLIKKGAKFLRSDGENDWYSTKYDVSFYLKEIENYTKEV